MRCTVKSLSGYIYYLFTCSCKKVQHQRLYVTSEIKRRKEEVVGKLKRHWFSIHLLANKLSCAESTFLVTFIHLECFVLFIPRINIQLIESFCTYKDFYQSSSSFFVWMFLTQFAKTLNWPLLYVLIEKASSLTPSLLRSVNICLNLSFTDGRTYEYYSN